ncbi:MAG: hypothetical protein U0263_08415 [Polyangiaceae bacterium]
MRRERLLCIVFAAGLGAACGSESEEPARKASDAGSDASDAPDAAAEDAGTDSLDEEASAPSRTAGSCGATSWAQRFGGSAPGSISALEAAIAVVTDPQGAVFTGSYYGDVDFGGGSVVAGKQNRSMFVTARSLDGSHRFSRGFGDAAGGVIHAPAARGNAIARLPAGGFVVAGGFAGGVDFGKGTLTSSENPGDSGVDAGLGFCFACFPDVVVLALDEQGQTQWAERFGGPDGDAAQALAVNAAGTIFVAGTFSGLLDFGAGISLTSAGGSDAFVAALDASGGPKWAKRFGGAKDDAALAAAVDTAGTLVVGGAFTGGGDFGGTNLTAAGESDGFWLSLDSAGNVLDRHGLGASQRGAVAAIAARPGGGWAVAGSVRGQVTFAQKAQSTAYTDAFVLNLDSSGKEAWARVFGTTENDGAAGVALRADGHVIVTGTLGSGPLDLGGGPLSYELSDGAFLLELDGSGAHVCSRRWSAKPNNEPVGDSGQVTTGASMDGFAVAAGAKGEIWWGGALAGRADIGKGELVSSGGVDLVLAKLAP